MNIIKELKKENNKESYKIMLEDLGLIRNITDKINMYIMNSYDMQIVKRDLIGMAQEMKLRETTLKEELGDDVDAFTKEIIENSRGPSKLEIFLTILKSYTLVFMLILGGTILLSKDIYRPISVYFPIFTGILLTLQIFIELIFTPVFNLDKSYRRFIPKVFIGLTFFVFIISDLNEFMRLGPHIQTIYLIIFFLIIYIISYFAYNKHIETLAKDSENIVEDLMNK